MDERKRSRRDFLQNVIITLLSLSAVFLFTRTQIYNLGEQRYSELFSPTAVQSDMTVSQQPTGLRTPLRLAVSGPYGRYAVITLRTDDESFDVPGRLLGEAIGSAKTYIPCDEQDFLSALDGTSVYYDFLHPLPLSLVAGLVGSSSEEDVNARALTVSAADGDLYLWDGAEEYRRYTTAVTPESLDSVVNRYELGNAVFAMDGINGKELESIAPYALFLQEEPVLPVLTERISAFDADRLLQTMQFNPNTHSRYMESTGTEVVVENGRTLRIHTDGSIVYRSGGDATLTVEAGENSALPELAAGCGALLQKLTASAEGQSSLYLEQVQKTGEQVTLVYGYEAGGVPVRFSDGGHAATVTLSGTAVTALELRLRSYVETGEESSVLPLRQAAAIAERYEETELFIGYAGDGTGRVSVHWLAE